jgi:hypothetical protein
VTDDEERELRCDLMTIQIEKFRHDMRWETRKFVLQIVAALGAAFAGGAAFLGLILHWMGKL